MPHAKEIPGPFINMLSFIDSQGKPVPQWLKLLQLCRKFICTLHEAVERIWRKTETVLCITKLQGTIESDIFSLIVVKTLVHFLPPLFEQEHKISSPQMCCAFKVHLESLHGFPWSLLKLLQTLPAWCQKVLVDNQLDSSLSSQLTTPVSSLTDDFPFLSWWSEAYKYLFCCCGNPEVCCHLLVLWFHLWDRKNGPFEVNGCRSKQTGDKEFIQ